MAKHSGAFVDVVSQGPVRGLFLPGWHQRTGCQDGSGKTAARGALMQSLVRHARRIVVKVGSSLVTAEGRGLDHAALSRWAEQIAALTAQGKEVVLVSSGAIAEGIARLGWKKRPQAVNELQAAAAVGQMGLVQAYESIFRTHGLHAAQVLLTHEDLADRTRDRK